MLGQKDLYPPQCLQKIMFWDSRRDAIPVSFRHMLTYTGKLSPFKNCSTDKHVLNL